MMNPRTFPAGWRPALLAGLFAALVPSLHARSWLVDFGPNNGTDGSVTPSGTPVINPGNGSTGVADSNNNYWNNVVGAGATGGPVAMSYLRLIDTTNAPTKVGLTLGPNWKSNGRNNGGLFPPDAMSTVPPDPAKLGHFAIERATEDYFFVDGANGNSAMLSINNLDPGKLYNLRLFGTRDAPSVRKTLYTASAGNGVFSTVLQTSGADLVSVTDGNDSTIASLNGLQPDATGQLTLRVTAMEGGFAYLGILELIEGDPAPPIVTNKVRVDFGRHDGTNGNATASPDVFGNHWNNFGVTANGTIVSNLVTTTNAATTMGITLTSANWQNNGILNGGLTATNGQSPMESRLGDLAVETATQDYFFNSGATGLTTSLKVTGLSPTKHYSMRFFGSRKANNATDIRRSTYTVVAGNGTFAGTLQTTGPGIGNGLGGDDGTTTYDGNNRTTVALGGMQPTTAGELTLQMSIAEGGFSHLNILEIVESASVPPLALSGEVDRWTSQDALDPVAPGGVLFVGSSSIRRWENLTKDFADYRIVQRGFGGSQFSDLNPIVNRIVTPYQPSAIVVFEGTNDIRVGGKTGEQVKADFENFVTLVRAQMPTVPICFIGITPVPSFFNVAEHDGYRRTANSLIKTYCESTAGLHFFDTNTLLDDLYDNNFEEWQTYFVDDTHLNRKGYDHFTSVIRPKLEAVLAPNKTFTANPNTLVAGEKLFFDFGPSDIVNGDQTLAPDANGNRWNNWHATNGGVGIHAGEHLPNLVRSTGTNTGIRMTMTAGFLCNGKTPFGGLYAPQAGLLGELATETATNDFFYSTANDVNDGLSDDIGGGFMLEGLDPALSYEFRFLGARDNTQPRTTKYDIHGSNSGTANLITSGTGISSNGTGNINDDEVAVISGIRPDAFGQVWVDLTLVQGDFAYVNAMQITASTPVTATPLQSWRSSQFTAGELGNAALEATLWGNDADPDSDGRVNLLEYACGTDPRSTDADPTAFALVDDGGEFITLTYQRNLDATDVTFLVQKADNLTDWSGVTDTAVSTAGNIETRKATVSRAGFDRLWLRLKVELAAAM